MRRIASFVARVWMLIAVAWLIMFGGSAGAQSPYVGPLAPSLDSWLQQIASTARGAYVGRCKIETLRADVRCHLYADALRGILWIVAFDDPASAEPTLILFAHGDQQATLAWCAPKHCPEKT